MAGRFSQVVAGSDTVESFNRTWNVLSNPNRKMLTVNVSWNDVDSNPHQVSLSTMIDYKSLGGF